MSAVDIPQELLVFLLARKLSSKVSKL